MESPDEEAGDVDRLRHERRPGGLDGGLTLLELLVVIVILGTLSGIVVFAVRSMSDDASAAACATDARLLTEAEERHRARHDGDLATEQQLVARDLLRAESDLWDLDVGVNDYSLVATGDCTATAEVATGPIVLASFAGDDGTRLSDLPADTGQPFTEVAGRWTVRDGRARSDGSTLARATVDADTAEVDVSVTVHGGSSARAGLALNADADGAYAVQVWRFGDWGYVLVLRQERGGLALPSHTVGRLDGGSSFDLRVAAAGGAYDVFLDDRLVHSYSMPERDRERFASRTGFGLSTYYDAQSSFDDLRVTARA